MSTIHRVPIDGEDRMILLTKGAPDLALARCSEATTSRRGYVPIQEAIESIEEANTRLGSEGRRVLSLAFRPIDPWDEDAAPADPMSFVQGPRFVAFIGIIDPLRPSSKEAVRNAQEAGIDVRMMTGDYAVTTMAIDEDLGSVLD